jgi:hypothetical protein
VKRIEKGEREGVRREGVRREVVRNEDKEVREEGKGATEEKTGAASGSHTAEPVQIPDCSRIGGSIGWLKFLLCLHESQRLAHTYTHELVEPTAREGGGGIAEELVQWNGHTAISLLSSL